ncbi:bifunctional tRNA (5-methylaminomethyl-2-thiouridine)(34)-methyltransferase MnmD/FAD-dependent 5-carboxymethylaminomethyl-2-thiouridine(34) oxidoreductase MnmC [Sansalvadorimonas verongulae]|uniref:bifunctional tRNA (5-methylaminomethyl-2-thiouridine)(34)-methyltransferase MnmD/FAD-dependent 5-carboxymethylaminomethyl-2-thiouridine(34) oxidoreductase MnmC n=1 Tax=Sansalvadorimonas verongulae TaxID=2172824 RepID=UPI0012BC2F04|nr:bifunctional tRNA (5-methylaminomethyl-2-thiouridine)(34)-methyltransferase MnmD/FAD-dependent 5-carboxymethylaminomethyl-2-thiouridine(34) oxidoreductase MnmC [Sansalvadorimonas verongulae]MTI13824.1 bifunctional tRNA (5-methylaminomethyl-2-thiouridine)(34)-methyltransferase MnmD/FAD-dependent 5-carboxymethylaminomethyl-2-thiouridine(34) oxidoreductase MnmC [Sansalvadorimonas verongulae]
MTLTQPQIQNAKISWNEDGQPFSVEFDDVYFSTDCGVSESRYVFIEQNDLPRRFAALKEHETFTIAETGFGSGLNFLCTWHCFLEHAPATAQLHFVTVEKFPMTQEDFARALALWPEFKEMTDALVASYPPRLTGFHRRTFDSGRVKLTLIFDDVHRALPKINPAINAWFLDGFSPAKNPEMWQPELFHNIAAKSAPGATYATFAVARMVRMGIKEVGMTMTRVSGYGKKREMIRGQIPHQTTNVNKPWLESVAYKGDKRQALIIGAGLAGASTAHALAERGWQVTVLDKNERPADGASGNPQGMLYTRLSAHNTLLTQLVAQGYSHSTNLLQNLPEDLYHQTGIIQLPDTEKEQARQQELIDCHRFDDILKGMTKEQLSEIAGLPIEKDGLWFKDGGWVCPPRVVSALLNHKNITFRGSSQVKELNHDGENWQVQLEDGTSLLSPVTIIACGHQAAQLSQSAHLPLKSIRGQVTVVLTTNEGKNLQTVLCEEGYIAPQHDGFHTLGATFHFNDDDQSVRAKDHQTNLDTIASFAPAIGEALSFNELDTDALQGRTGFRCTTPDYLPAVGPIMDETEFRGRFAALGKNAKTHIDADVPFYPGLYINTGHGSRGLITCPLAGELLASEICGEALPVSDELFRGLRPGRFLARRLIKGK